MEESKDKNTGMLTAQDINDWLIKTKKKIENYDPLNPPIRGIKVLDILEAKKTNIKDN